jgi:hypothetical protein
VAEEGAEEPTRVLRVHQAQVLFAAGNPDVDAAPEWRQIQVKDAPLTGNHF